MPKLQKFKKKTDKVSIKNLLISFGIIFLGLTILGVYKTFAIYKIDKEYDLIVSKIGDFRGLNLITKYYINGTENSKAPTDKNYEVYVTCDNANGSWDYNNWKLNIEDATKYKVNCEIDFREKYVLASAKSTTNTITTTYSNIDTASSEYCMYGTDANNLDSRKDNDCNLTNLSSDTTYYFKKCYEYNNEEICSNVSSLLTGGKVTDFDYTGGEQTYETICNGTYKLETWGAQGGTVEGFVNSSEAYGGYSNGKIKFQEEVTLYINNGGMGNSYINNANLIVKGNGYNGGGSATRQINDETQIYYGSGGGGATHIALQSGLLSTLEKENGSILIVSGGGGASATSSTITSNPSTDGTGGSGGGYVGNSGTYIIGMDETYKNIYEDDRWYGTGGNQITGGTSKSISSLEYVIDSKFGKGCDVTNSYFLSYMKTSGGGGYYGGGCGTHSGGGGGSGYIGNPLLTNKSMYCYECEESTEENTKTVSTTCASSTPTQNCAKIGNGYAKITIEGCSI